MDQDCIFCQIVRGDAPASIVHLAGVLGDRLGVVPVLNISGGLHIVAGFGPLILLHAARSAHTPAGDLPIGTG